MQRLLTHVIAAPLYSHVNKLALQPAQRRDLLERKPPELVVDALLYQE